MEQLRGDKDEQLAAGLAIGGTASLIGSAAQVVVGGVAGKLGAIGALKLGIELSLFAHPVVASVLIIGGVGYLIHKGKKAQMTE